MELLKKFRYNYNYWLRNCYDPKSSLAKTIKSLDEIEQSNENFNLGQFEKKIAENPNKYLIIDL